MFSFLNLVCFVLQLARKSIPINYSQFLDNFSSDFLPPFVFKQTGSKVRQKIFHKTFLELFRLGNCAKINLHFYTID